jgi:hypothetical protein
MTLTTEELIKLMALLAQIEASGERNGKPTLGLAGAEEAFFTIQEFIEQLEKERAK